MQVFIIKFDFIQTMAFASVLYWVGVTLCRKVKPLAGYNIPPAVAGGLMFALFRAILSPYVAFDFDMALMDPFMVAFFATIGMGASLELLKRGGSVAFRLLFAASILLVLQNGLALLIASFTGLDFRVAILAGSATMTGGHGTGLVFARSIADIFGTKSAEEVAVACATFGLIAGSILGGPLAERLIRRGRLAEEIRTGSDYRKNIVSDVFNFGDEGGKISSHSILMTIFQITFASSVGIWVSSEFNRNGIVLPAYVIALVVGVIIRNIGDHVQLLRVRPRIVNYISGASLSFFLAFALMSINILALKGLAGVLIFILAAQVVLIAIFAWYITYRITGADYQASVITAGHCGFGLGATPNAIANMEAICARYGEATDAFFAVAAVGAFFIDLINALVINVLIRVI